MALEQIKAKPLTKDEARLLISLIERSKIVKLRTTNAINNKLKKDEWICLAKKFNSMGALWPRTPQQLRLKWENMKKNSRKRSARIRMSRKPGIPPEYIPPDEILDRVAKLLLENKLDRQSAQSEADEDDANTNSDDSDDGFDVSNVKVKVEMNETPDSSPLELDDSCTRILSEYEHVMVNRDGEGVQKRPILNHSTSTVNKRLTRSEESRIARDNAIAEYFLAKKQTVYIKLKNLNLENEYLQLRNLELKLSSEKLVLEKEKLELELQRLRNK